MIGAFSYHKAIAPMIWVLIGLASIELVVVHLLLAHWWPRVAIVVAVVTAATIVWLVIVVRSFRRMPVVLDADRLLMRVGRLYSVSVPTDHISGLRSSCDGAALKRRHVLNLALVAYPNVVVDLTAPIAVGRRRISTIAHRLDDPAGFAAALNRLGACRMTEFEDPLGPLDPNFADNFRRDMRRPPCQLYLVSPLDVGGDFPERLARALDAGPVAAFQFRVKDIDQHAAAALGEPLRKICLEREVAFIVNDDIGLAKRLDADGVHLGQDDGDPREARAQLGPNAQIGVSCHGSRHLAMEAGEAGADYVAFGAFYPSTTKTVTQTADPVTLSWWSTLFEIPCVAIGGITPENAAALVAAGADFIAVSNAVWGGDEVAAIKAFGEVLAKR